ncbi:hypothetical protein ACVBIL_01245 [Shewanella sp. 125m-7]
MAKMMGGSSGLEDFADICCGSGSLTLAHINQTFLDGGAKEFARLNIMGYFLNELMGVYLASPAMAACMSGLSLEESNRSK